MAEITVGGIQIAVSAKRTDRECQHTQTMSTISAGIERIVCEDCGHLGFNYLAVTKGSVDRASFARPADNATPAEQTLRRQRPRPEHPAFEDEPDTVSQHRAFETYRLIPPQWPAATRHKYSGLRKLERA